MHTHTHTFAGMLHLSAARMHCRFKPPTTPTLRSRHFEWENVKMRMQAFFPLCCTLHLAKYQTTNVAAGFHDSNRKNNKTLQTSAQRTKPACGCHGVYLTFFLLFFFVFLNSSNFMCVASAVRGCLIARCRFQLAFVWSCVCALRSMVIQ